MPGRGESGSDEESPGEPGGRARGLRRRTPGAGPVDLPIVGLLLACGIVASGSWFVMEMGWTRAWFAGLVGIAGASVWLLMFPPANDAFVSTEQWVSVAWLALAPLSAAIPAIWTTRRRDR